MASFGGDLLASLCLLLFKVVWSHEVVANTWDANFNTFGDKNRVFLILSFVLTFLVEVGNRGFALRT